MKTELMEQDLWFRVQVGASFVGRVEGISRCEVGETFADVVLVRLDEPCLSGVWGNTFGSVPAGQILHVRAHKGLDILFTYLNRPERVLVTVTDRVPTGPGRQMYRFDIRAELIQEKSSRIAKMIDWAVARIERS